jgi:Ca2+-binding RTX toxin-like protein
MVLESNRELVLRRLLECLARDRTKHQVAEVTSLGLVQMTRKRVGAGLLEAFSTPCECCNGRGVILTFDPDTDTPAPHHLHARSNNGGGNGGNGGNGSNSGNCPVGSTVASGGLCEIAAGSEGNSSAITFNAGDIYGGTVYSLAYAREHYNSLCLDGPGPNYAVIGNNADNTIKVSGTRQRVLGLGGADKITVKSGPKTCVDAGTGNDTVKAGKAAVRVYGGEGNDKITVGNGNDVVYGGGGQDKIKAGNGNDSLNGGAGNDKIKAGNGTDRLYGNAGADKLTAGTGRDYLFGGPGNDMMRARGNVAYVNGGNGHNVAYVKRPMASFARKHGTKHVHII